MSVTLCSASHVDYCWHEIKIIVCYIISSLGVSHELQCTYITVLYRSDSVPKFTTVCLCVASSDFVSNLSVEARFRWRGDGVYRYFLMSQHRVKCMLQWCTKAAYQASALQHALNNHRTIEWNASTVGVLFLVALVVSRFVALHYSWPSWHCLPRS